jgi:hypothetical protein
MTILSDGVCFQQFTTERVGGVEIESPCRMTIASLRQPTLISEPPARREFTIAIVTVYAIIVTLLAGELISRVGDTESKSLAPHSRLRTFDV